MTKANYSGKGSANLKERGSYVYDYRGLLVKKSYQDYNPSDFVEVVNDEASKPVTEFYEYTADGKVIYNERSEDNKTKKTTYIWANTTLWCEINEGVVYYHHTDHLGTTEVVTDENGTVVWEAGYEAFGSVLSERGDSSFCPSYTGKFFDKASGLYYFNARWYDSELGKFTTQDPARDGANWWNYCNGNPVIIIDWTGLDAFNAVLKPSNYKGQSWFSKNIFEPTEKFFRRNLGISGPSDYIKLYDGTIVQMSESGERFAYSERITDCNFFLVTSALSVFKLAKASNVLTLNTKTTSGVKLRSSPDKTTTVLGRYESDTSRIIDELKLSKSVDFSGNKGGFNLLNTPDELYKNPSQFWQEYNKPFIDAAIERGDRFLMSSPCTKENLFMINSNELTGYGKEFYYLQKRGYELVGNEMIKVVK